MAARKAATPRRVTASGKKRVVIVKSAAYVNRTSNITKKKPSPRLKKRRAANTVQGRYPNPFDNQSAELAHSFINKALDQIDKKTGIEKQAAVSYAQGAIEALYRLGVFKIALLNAYVDSLRLRMK